MATHSCVLAWRIPGTGEPGRLPSMGLLRVRHNWSDLAAAGRALAGSSSRVSSEVPVTLCICSWHLKWEAASWDWALTCWTQCCRRVCSCQIVGQPASAGELLGGVGRNPQASGWSWNLCSFLLHNALLDRLDSCWFLLMKYPSLAIILCFSGTISDTFLLSCITLDMIPQLRFKLLEGRKCKCNLYST